MVFCLLELHSSVLSSNCADEARTAVLSFFQASAEYTVVFTSNATGALKLVGESYPFTNESKYVLGVDSHNSVHGIREFAIRSGAKVCYIDSTVNGGFEESLAKVYLPYALNFVVIILFTYTDYSDTQPTTFFRKLTEPLCAHRSIEYI